MILESFLMMGTPHCFCMMYQNPNETAFTTNKESRGWDCRRLVCRSDGVAYFARPSASFDTGTCRILWLARPAGYKKHPSKKPGCICYWIIRIYFMRISLPVTALPADSMRYRYTPLSRLLASKLCMAEPAASALSSQP